MFKAKDGHEFPSLSRQRLYEESKGNLRRPSLTQPGEGKPEDAIEHHGHAREYTVRREGNQHRVTATMEDGTRHTSVHPDAEQAHEAAGQLMGVGGGRSSEPTAVEDFEQNEPDYGA